MRIAVGRAHLGARPTGSRRAPSRRRPMRTAWWRLRETSSHRGAAARAGARGARGRRRSPLIHLPDPPAPSSRVRRSAGRARVVLFPHAAGWRVVPEGRQLVESSWDSGAGGTEPAARTRVAQGREGPEPRNAEPEERDRRRRASEAARLEQGLHLVGRAFESGSLSARRPQAPGRVSQWASGGRPALFATIDSMV